MKKIILFLTIMTGLVVGCKKESVVPTKELPPVHEIQYVFSSNCVGIGGMKFYSDVSGKPFLNEFIGSAKISASNPKDTVQIFKTTIQVDTGIVRFQYRFDPYPDSLIGWLKFKVIEDGKIILSNKDSINGNNIKNFQKNEYSFGGAIHSVRVQ
jgi:hypothetical protein